VTAHDKGNNKKETLEIKAQGHGSKRLTKEQIEDMIREAELQSESDKAVKAKIDAKNSLEHYVYQMKNTIEDKDKLADKVTDEDK